MRAQGRTATGTGEESRIATTPSFASSNDEIDLLKSELAKRLTNLIQPLMIRMEFVPPETIQRDATLAAAAKVVEALDALAQELRGGRKKPK